MGNKLNIINECKELYFLVKEELKNSKEYDLTKHALRSIVSIGSNIAEGNERTSKEFIRFINISLGSLAEFEFQWQLFNIKNLEIENKISKIRAMSISLKSSIAGRDS